MFKGANRAPARLLRKGIKGALKKQDQIQDSRTRNNSPDPSLLDDKRERRPEHPRKDNIYDYDSYPSITIQVLRNGLQEPALTQIDQAKKAFFEVKHLKVANGPLTEPVSDIRSTST
ncbi:hypothetical protein [Pseudomonas sp. TE50-2]|uniref:hypothetical protein n=1 Tax=Pseudomonas sp. TE50-2 TaxID=3142707 RepID=UPI003466792F